MKQGPGRPRHPRPSVVPESPLEYCLILQALGALPYIILLDHDSKSVVVSIRGSVTSADWITDMLGVPERLDDWIPDSFREARPIRPSLS